MSRRDLIGGGLEIVDVGGSFQRFLQNAPKEARLALRGAVEKTAFALQQRMAATAPVGPDSPHIRTAVTHTVRGLTAQVGYIDATQAAGPGNDASIADVALFNEYTPNEQPFMRPSAFAEQSPFVRRATDALKGIERSLSAGGQLL